MKRLALFIAVIAVGLAAAVTGGIAAQRKLQDDALSDAFARLRLFHELRRAALEDYLRSMASDVRAASENPASSMPRKSSPSPGLPSALTRASC
jgi:hypothetical protein